MVKSVEDLSFKGLRLLGTKYAIMGGAMSWISEHNLVSAISNAGGFGIIACGSMSANMLELEIALTKKMTNNPFGVNIIIIHPEIHGLLDICIKSGVSHIIFAGGVPKKDIINYVKGAGIKVIGFAPTVGVAMRLIRNGVDGLIIEGMEAGGHIGPVSTSVLAQEILPVFKESSVPIFIAGGIAHGSMMVNYLNMGASGCQMGTIFVCAEESIAHNNFKSIFIDSSSRDTAVSAQISDDFAVIPVRAIKNHATKEFLKFQQETINEYHDSSISKENAQLKIEKYWAGALKKAVIHGDVEYGSVMAGQSVGMINNECSVKEIINTFVQQGIVHL